MTDEPTERQTDEDEQTTGQSAPQQPSGQEDPGTDRPDLPEHDTADAASGTDV